MAPQFTQDAGQPPSLKLKILKVKRADFGDGTGTMDAAINDDLFMVSDSQCCPGALLCLEDRIKLLTGLGMTRSRPGCHEDPHQYPEEKEEA